MCHRCERKKLLKRAEAILADIEGGYELKRAEIARLIRDMSTDIKAQNNLAVLVAMALDRDPVEVEGRMTLALGITAHEQ